MEIKSLKYYVTVYETGSFSDAAHKLFLSQQAVSLSVKTLENNLGTQLFKRTHTGIIPTVDGTYLYRKAKELLLSYDSFELEIGRYFRHHSGVIDIMLAPSMLIALSPNIFSEYQERNPDVRINIMEAIDSVCKEKIRNYQASFGITPKPCSMDGWDFIHVRDESLVVLVNISNPLSKQVSLTLEDLSDEKFILLSKECELHDITLELCRYKGYRPSVIFETWELSLALSLVSRGKGIFICPEYYFWNTDYPNVVSVPFSDPSLVYDIGILTRNDKSLGSMEKAFIRFFMQKCGMPKAKADTEK